MKTLLFFPKLEEKKEYHHLPISALAVSTYLLERGDGVAVFDQRVDDPAILMSLVEKADQVMISCYTGYQLFQGYEFAKMVKKTYPNKSIIMGGPHASALPEQTLASPYVDDVICGDVDTGIMPLPYYLIDVQKYVNPTTKRFAYVSSYSCPGICTFCQTNPRRKLTYLPSERIEKDINNLMSLFPFEEAVFFDATLFTYPARVGFIAQLLKRHNLQWIADARADEICRIDFDFLQELIFDSNLVQLTIGLETGSQRIVDKMKKGKNHLVNFERTTTKLSNFPIKQVSGVVFGTPGETPEDLKATIAYVDKMKEINPNFYVSSTIYKPLPKTEMSKMCESYGYQEPQSLEEWAALGAASHYNYNIWEDAPWIIGQDEYREIYEQWKRENKYLFV